MIRYHETPKDERKRRDPRCTCGKPLLLYIPPGEHAHPCPVHPERAVYGSGPIL